MKDFDEKLLALIQTYKKEVTADTVNKEELTQEIKVLFIHFLLQGGRLEDSINKYLNQLKIKFHPDNRTKHSEEIQWIESVFNSNPGQSQLIIWAEEVQSELLSPCKPEKQIVPVYDAAKLSDLIQKIALRKNEMKPKYLGYWFLNSLESLLRSIDMQQKSAEDHKHAWASLFNKALPLITTGYLTQFCYYEVALCYGLGITLCATGSTLQKQNLPLSYEVGTMALTTGKAVVGGSTIFMLELSKLNFLMAHFVNVGAKKSLKYARSWLSPFWGKTTHDNLEESLDDASPILSIAEPLSTYTKLTEKQWASTYRKGGKKSELFLKALDDIKIIDKTQKTIDEKALLVEDILNKLEENPLLNEKDSRSAMALFCAKLMLLSIQSTKAFIKNTSDSPIDLCILLLEQECTHKKQQSFLEFRVGGLKLRDLQQKIEALKILKMNGKIVDKNVQDILLGEQSENKLKASSSNTDNVLLRAWRLYEGSQPSESMSEKSFS